MKPVPLKAIGLRSQRALVLLALMLVTATGFAAVKATVPAAPTITAPAAGSQLPDPKKVTVRGTGSSLTKVTVGIEVSHVHKGRRVAGPNSLKKGADVGNDGQWKVDMGLPPMQRGWEDVRYTITATLYWDKRAEQYHVSEKGSVPDTVEVLPQSQPEPLPVAPPRPEILTPTSSTLLKREPSFSITGTGTPGNQIHVSTRLHYALENRPTYDFSPHGQSDKVTVDKSGKWSTVLGYGGYTEPGYVNARVRITVKESHREKPSLFSPEVIREVPVEVPPQRGPARNGDMSRLVTVPDHVIASSNRIGAMTPTQREALTRPVAKITSPTVQSTATGSVEPKGTAAPGSNVEVSVKRTMSYGPAGRGKRLTSRSSDDLGTFTAKTNSSGQWKVRAVTLPALKRDSMDVSVVISVVELNADGSKTSPHTITLKQAN